MGFPILSFPKAIMKPMTRPPFRRRKLGRRLRQMREQSGMTVDEAALALDKKRNTLYRIEAGESLADVHLARSMMDIYDVYLPNLLDDVRDAQKPGWWVNFGLKAMGYVDVETEAYMVRELALIHIPGLLQTEHYMRAVFEAYSLKRSKAELASQIKVRMIRQNRLTNEAEPLNLVALVDECALRQMIGGPDVMRDQLNHLIMMAELSTVTLHVLPRGLGAHAGQTGSFTMVEFPDAEDSPLLYVEYPTGSIHVEDGEEVGRARLLLDHLLGRALGPDDSVAVIEQIIAE